MKIFPWLVISFLLSTSNAIANPIGKGELKIYPNTVKNFIKYIKNTGQRVPGLFLIAESGRYSTWWYCGAGHRGCDYSNNEVKDCEKKIKKFTGKREKCFVFAKVRKIVWDNGNDFSAKERSFKSRWSEQRINEKLTQLGFLGSKKFINRKTDDAAFEKETRKYREDFKKKMDKKNKLITKQSNNKNENNIVTQLKALTDLNKQGAISDEEFKLAKKKLLTGN